MDIRKFDDRKICYSEDGTISLADYRRIVSAGQTLNHCVFPPDGGYTDKNGIDHVPIALVSSPDEIIAALVTMTSIFGLEVVKEHKAEKE